MSLIQSKKDRYSAGNDFFQELQLFANHYPLGVPAKVLASCFKSAERRMEDADGATHPGSAYERKKLICAFTADAQIPPDTVSEAALLAWGRPCCFKLGLKGFVTPEPLAESIRPDDAGQMLVSQIKRAMQAGDAHPEGGIVINSPGSEARN